MENKPVVFTDEELMLLGMCLLVSAHNLAESRDAVQDAINHTKRGNLGAILEGMEIVREANRQLALLGQITEKLGNCIP